MICPYPSQYTSSFVLPNGQTAVIWAIRPEDETLLVQLHRDLSVESVHQRYAHAVPLSVRVTHEQLSSDCFVDYDREIALVVDCEAGEMLHQIIAVGRLLRIPGTYDRELSLVVSDRFQGQGIGTRVMQRLMQIADQEGVHRVMTYISAVNAGMRRLCDKLGFALQSQTEGTIAVRNIKYF